MSVQITLDEFPSHTHYVPLAILGHCLSRTGFLQPVWDALDWPIKTCEHTPSEKLQDVLVSIMAGHKNIAQINTRLRPDVSLATAWNRRRFADQSNITKMLNGLSRPHVEQLRAGHDALFRQYSQTVCHDFDEAWLVMDIDLTGLRASKQAEQSCKGYFSGQRNQYGRQVMRVSIPTYHETLLSSLYPGNQPGNATFKPTLALIQQRLNLSKEQRRRTILRCDAGFGTDENVNWGLWQQFQVLMKGYSGRRAQLWAARIADDAWLNVAAGRGRQMAVAVNPPRFGRHVNLFVLRWPGKKKLHYATLVSSLSQLSPEATWRLYDGRGAAEVEIKADKQGLRLPRRRKRSFAAQEALILLTDIAHNILSWVHHGILEDTPFADFGTERMVDELLCIPGTVEYMGGKLHKVALLNTHPYADLMRPILQNLLDFFASP
jgi:hypothetical protein